MTNVKVVLVTGGRNYRDPSVVSRYLTQIMPSMIIEGGANGADRLAKIWARDRGIHVATVDALWDYYDRGAGPIRNSAMLMLKPDVVLAFPGNEGTADMVKKALKAGITVIEVKE